MMAAVRLGTEYSVVLHEMAIALLCTAAGHDRQLVFCEDVYQVEVDTTDDWGC